MSIKGDVIAVALAGVVVLAVGWYAKRKITSAASGVKDSVVSAANWLGQPIDGVINAAGQLITGNPTWNQNSSAYDIPKDFGVYPGAGWGEDMHEYDIPSDFGLIDPKAGW